MYEHIYTLKRSKKCVNTQARGQYFSFIQPPRATWQGLFLMIHKQKNRSCDSATAPQRFQTTACAATREAALK